MFKKNRLEVAECIDGEYVFLTDKSRTKGAIGFSAVSSTLILPVVAFADSGSTFNKIYDAALKAVDAGVVFVIMFAGAAWILGNRGKSLEMILGASAGYLVFRNAVHIRDFLKALVPEMGAL